MNTSTLTVRCQTCGTTKPSTDGWGGTVVYCADCAKDVGPVAGRSYRPTRLGVIRDGVLTQADNSHNLKYLVCESIPSGVANDVVTPDYLVDGRRYHTGLLISGNGSGRGVAWPTPHKDTPTVTHGAARTAIPNRTYTVTATRTTPADQTFTVDGLPAYSVETRDRVRAAISNTGETWPTGKIAVHVGPNCTAPSSSFDLAAACAVLAAGGTLHPAALNGIALIGELGLDGTVRPVPGIHDAVATAQAAGISTAVIAEDDLAHVDVAGISIHGVDSLRAALDVLRTIGRTAATCSGEHRPVVPPMPGIDPYCSCGWTPHPGYDLRAHLTDMGAWPPASIEDSPRP